MGATCAPSYANLFLGMWERECVQQELQSGMGQVINWLRYIDDVLFIWQDPLADLHRFIVQLNDNHQNIRLTHKISRTSLESLDIKIIIDPTGHLSTTIHRKKTSANALLHASSFHPQHTIRSIPVG